LKATMGQLLRDGQLHVLVQWGTESDPDISALAGRDVPLITTYARSDADRGALRLLASTSALSRPILAPPGVPADRIEILRNAFDQTMRDPEFLEDAKKSAMDIKPSSGKAIQTLVESVIHTPANEVTLAAELVQ
jgi:hypothetical protein